MKITKYLLTLAFGATVFGAVACSDDPSSSALFDDGKENTASWTDVLAFDKIADLPSCDKFDGAAAQVMDRSGFFACVDGKWEQIGVSVPAYDKLPKCDAAMNDFCVYIEENEDIDAAYICDEGVWIKGMQLEGFNLCMKDDENSSGQIENAMKEIREECKENNDESLKEFLEKNLPKSSFVQYLKKELEESKEELELCKINQAHECEIEEVESEVKILEGQIQNLENEIKDDVRAAVDGVDNALQRVIDQQTIVGASSNRLDFESENLSTSSENLQAAEGMLSDADMAKEMVEYTTQLLLEQAAQAMLAQANQNAQCVLALLQ